MKPYMITSVENYLGTSVKKYSPEKAQNLFGKPEVDVLKEFLRAVVTQGTGTKLKSDLYTAYGKTGTAQKRPVSERKYLVSFIGCVPAEDPDIAYYVIMDEPHVKDQAHSTYATEFASRLMKKVLPFLGQYATK